MASSDRTGQQIGTYRYLRLLERGGFGDVYLAEHIHLGTQAVIKVLHTQLTSDDARDFLNEARMIRLLHPNIVRLLDFGLSREDMPFLVMEYAQEGTLRQRHPKGTRVPLPTVISYVKQIAAALQYAHDQRIIHRDIKPENMLIGHNHVIMLSDFGIAAIAHTTSSLSMQDLAGTPSYMAPEQSQGMARAASDQYALAVCVYEWLCGAVPFQGTAMQVVMQHLLDSPPPLRQQMPTLPPAVEQVVLKALSKDPHHRFRTIAEFAVALEQASQAFPSLLSPASHSELASLSQNLPASILPVVEENSASSMSADLEADRPVASQTVVPLYDPEQTDQIGWTPLSVPINSSPLLRRLRSSFYHVLGKIILIFGLNNRALMAYEHAILLEPHRPQIYVSKGKVLFNLKRYKEAIAAYDEAIRLAPRSSKAYRERGKTFEQLAQQSYNEFKQRAQQSYEKAKEFGVE